MNKTECCGFEKTTVIALNIYVGSMAENAHSSLYFRGKAFPRSATVYKYNSYQSKQRCSKSRLLFFGWFFYATQKELKSHCVVCGSFGICQVKLESHGSALLECLLHTTAY